MKRLINLAIAAGLLVTAASHGYLYLHGYRYIAGVGPGFLVLTSVSVALAILIALGGPGWLRAAALLISLGALGAFVMSRTVGVMGFVERGWQPAPHALISVLAEAITVLLCAWSLLRRESAVPRSRAATS
jgi:hypothetical protein